MSTVKAHNIEPATGTDVALGAAGDSVTVSGDSLKLDTFKDAGGNTLFTSDGSGTLSSVNSGLKGAGPILIQSQTASNSASISFTSGLDSTYDKYMFVFVNMHPATNSVDFGFQVNAAGQSGFNETITSNVFGAMHAENDNDATLTYQSGSDQAQGTALQTLNYNTGNQNDASVSGELHLFNPASTTYVKHFYSRWITYFGHATSGEDQGRPDDDFTAGYFNTTSAIDAISFKMSSGNFDGVIQMYGIA